MLGGTTRCAGLVSVAIMALATFGIGCSTPLRSNLSEHDADALIVLLSDASVSASKQLDPATRRYRVDVSSLEVEAALRALQERGELHAKDKTAADLYAEPKLVPTPNEEHARHLLAMEGELARTLERFDDVLDARVHLSAPKARVLDTPAPVASASVLLRRAHGSAPIDDAKVQALIAGALSELEPARVSIVQIEAPKPRSAPALTRVGPFSVSQASAAYLRAALALGLLLNAVLALLVIVTLTRARRARRARRFGRESS
jgi:type III secretion system YscJ/HrcJ family lipoprotein